MRIGRYEVTFERPTRQLAGVAMVLALSLVGSFATMIRYLGYDPVRLAMSAWVPIGFCTIVLYKTRKELLKREQVGKTAQA